MLRRHIILSISLEKCITGTQAVYKSDAQVIIYIVGDVITYASMQEDNVISDHNYASHTGVLKIFT